MTSSPWVLDLHSARVRGVQRLSSIVQELGAGWLQREAETGTNRVITLNLGVIDLHVNRYHIQLYLVITRSEMAK